MRSKSSRQPSRALHSKGAPPEEQGEVGRRFCRGCQPGNLPWPKNYHAVPPQSSHFAHRFRMVTGKGAMPANRACFPVNPGALPSASCLNQTAPKSRVKSITRLFGEENPGLGGETHLKFRMCTTSPVPSEHSLRFLQEVGVPMTGTRTQQPPLRPRGSKAPCVCSDYPKMHHLNIQHTPLRNKKKRPRASVTSAASLPVSTHPPWCHRLDTNDPLSDPARREFHPVGELLATLPSR